MVTQTVDLDDPVLGFTHTWVNALAERVAELHVVALAAGRRELAQNVTLRSFSLSGASPSRGGRFRFLMQAFDDLILGGKVDAIFVHMIPRWVILAAPFARLRSLPIVLWYTHSALSRQLRLAHRLADKIVTASPESYPLWGEDKVVAIGHGIDTVRFQPQERDEDGCFRVLSLGRMSPVKQYEVLIEAAYALVHRNGMDNLRVRLVGGPARADDVSYLRRLQAMVYALGLNRHVIFAGAVPYTRVEPEYQAADMFVNLSLSQGLDKAVLEAMATGLPVVTSNPSFFSVLPLNSTYRPVISYGSVDVLANAMEKLSAMDIGERKDIGSANRRRVEANHSVGRLADRMIEAMVSK